MNFVCYVCCRATGGKIGVITQCHQLTFVRNGSCIEPLQCKVRQRDFIQMNSGQQICMSFAAQRITVDLFHQLSDAVDAITHHLWRITPCGCNQLVAHDQ